MPVVYHQIRVELRPDRDARCAEAGCERHRDRQMRANREEVGGSARKPSATRRARPSRPGGGGQPEAAGAGRPGEGAPRAARGSVFKARRSQGEALESRNHGSTLRCPFEHSKLQRPGPRSQIEISETDHAIRHEYSIPSVSAVCLSYVHLMFEHDRLNTTLKALVWSTLWFDVETRSFNMPSLASYATLQMQHCRKQCSSAGPTGARAQVGF